MFRPFKTLAGQLALIVRALNRLTDTVHGVAEMPPPDPALERRIAALELELERRHAEAEGLLLAAKGKFDATRASEERARRWAQSVNGAEESDELDEEEIRAAYEAAGVPLDDGGGGGAEGMQPVSPRVARRSERKAGARAMKFSR